ncbi:MAG: ABC transporter permease, partial [Ferruginibacter sp.]
MYLAFAWRYFKAKKSANAINIIAWVTTAVIAFAICCQVLVLSVFNGFEDLVKSLYSSFYTDLKIIPSSGKTFVLSTHQLAQIKKQPYVK